MSLQVALSQLRSFVVFDPHKEVKLEIKDVLITDMESWVEHSSLVDLSGEIMQHFRDERYDTVVVAATAVQEGYDLE